MMLKCPDSILITNACQRNARVQSPKKRLAHNLLLFAVKRCLSGEGLILHLKSKDYTNRLKPNSFASVRVSVFDGFIGLMLRRTQCPRSGKNSCCQMSKIEQFHQNRVWIEGGVFRMGSDAHYADETPVRTVKVDGFWMDAKTVTNAEFAAFVEDTGYVTVAERPLNPADYPGADPFLLVPGSMVFRMTKGPVDLKDITNWWAYVPGACWKHPEGKNSTIDERMDHPVVQVCFEDAQAYAQWAGKDLPTEAEWEYAARGGLDGAEFVWGDKLTPGGKIMAKTWQGDFPWRNKAKPKLHRTAPVGSYPPNGFGLYDMAGNVWQWTTDWYVDRHEKKEASSCCTLDNPRGPAMKDSLNPQTPHIKIPRKVVKGGSFLCAPSYCRRYRPAARHAQEVDSGMSHIGFRCIQRPQPSE
jgi:formylglycine-generating enzyme required for sulfatase activity